MEENQTPPVKEEIPALVKPEKGWYAIYTHSRAEKRVSDRLTEAGIETFLPLQKTLRQWSDRKKLVEKPLISSYVFVKVVPREFFTVRKTDGVVKFIMLAGQARCHPRDPDNQPAHPVRQRCRRGSEQRRLRQGRHWWR